MAIRSYNSDQTIKKFCTRSKYQRYMIKLTMMIYNNNKHKFYNAVKTTRKLCNFNLTMKIRMSMIISCNLHLICKFIIRIEGISIYAEELLVN